MTNLDLGGALVGIVNCFWDVDYGYGVDWCSYTRPFLGYAKCQKHTQFLQFSYDGQALYAHRLHEALHLGHF